MTNGRTALQEVHLEGRRLLTRHFYGDGRWGWWPRNAREERAYQDWRVAKHRPKKLTWAKTSGPLSRKTHAIRYSLTATHKNGDVLRLTVWLCGQHASSPVRLQSHPAVVCAACFARVSGKSEVFLS